MILALAQLPPGLLFSGTIFLVALAFYGVLAVKMSTRATLTTQPFGPADAFCAAVLALWMINVIWHSLDAPKTITLKAILANSVVYSSLILGIVGVMGFQRESAAEFFGLRPSRFPKAAGTGLLWLVATYPLILATQSFVQGVFGETNDAQLIVRYFLEHPDPRHRAAVIVMAVIVAPMAEEILFRGYFYGVIRRYGGRLPAIFTSSLLFAAIHVHLPSMLGLGTLAVILCLLYERTGSLWATITMHATFNTMTIAVLILWPEMAH